MFGKQNSTAKNYKSSWFDLSFYNDTDYEVSRTQLNKRLQPGVTYTPEDLSAVDISFFAKNNHVPFNDVYEVRLNGTIESYSCPLGWVLENSTSRVQNVTCLDWEWVVRDDFTTDRPCIRRSPCTALVVQPSLSPAVICPREVPAFKNGTQTGTTNHLQLNESDPLEWNTYQKRITYTCPAGFVIERPDGRYGEQQDPMVWWLGEQDEFELECGPNALWEPVGMGGEYLSYMPYCIRK
jgi:hypothetical protein